jgi:glycosyltransferase involved in cell wall biosynthesis
MTQCRMLFEEKPEIECYFWENGWDWQLSSIIKKFKADLLLTNGFLSSPGLAIPQCTWIPTEMNKATPFFFYRKRLQKTLGHARLVFTDTEKSKQRLLEQYSLHPGKIIVLHPVGDENYQPSSEAEREKVKMKFAAGKEYFVVPPPYPTMGELIHLLKAFSLFKKRQQSNMQLILAGSDMEIPIEFYEKLETYKHQQDVHIYDFLEEAELIKIVTAAYALVYPFDKGSGIAMLNAFNCHVPVVAAEERDLTEIGADAALYADPMNHDQFANQLNLVYKDEKLRKEIIEKGKIRIDQYNRRHSVLQLWNALSGAIKN